MSQKYFDKYDDNFSNESSTSCCGYCCEKLFDCCGCIVKHISKQILKFVIFFLLIGLCVFGIYWGSNEITSLNNFSEIPDGCTIVSIDTIAEGESCNECSCNYYYNPFEFDKKRVCDTCDSIKFKYSVTTEHCGDQLLTMDDDYWFDKACGVEVKEVGQKYNCYLYKDCRGQYSFDTMYADQSELVMPIVVISLCSVLIILIFLIKCLCF